MTRLGVLIKCARNINGVRGETAQSGTATWASGGGLIYDSKTIFNLIEDQYEATLQDQIGQLYTTLLSWRTSVGSGVMSMIKTMAENTLITMAHDDTPLLQKTVPYAMDELIRQMDSSSDTVKANTPAIAAASAASGNVGNLVVIGSIIGPNGKNREYVFQETITGLVTNDKLSGGTARSEPLSFSGVAAESDRMNYLWPKGSGLSGKQITVCDNKIDATGVNLLTNSDFENWTSTNNLDNFVAATGVFGTDILRSTTVREGTYALSFLGDGATLSAVSQEFNTSTGTTAKLSPFKVYAFSAWCRVDVTPAAGVLAFSLVDSAGTVLNDDAGTANTITKDLTTVSTTYVNVTGFFRTKTSFDNTTVHKLRVKLTTALSNTRTVYIDDMMLREAVELYTGGPYIGVFAGTTDVLKNDKWTLAVTNDMNADTGGGHFQTWFERLFGMRTLVKPNGQTGFQLPSNSAGSHTINENLV